MRQLYLIFIFLTSTLSMAQQKILVYHETNGFRHNGAINNGITMFEDFGTTNGFTVDNSITSDVFTTANLAQYSAIVFLNTSGSDENGSDGDLLSASEKLAFETFIASGKGFIGIHAATDTYRDGVWPFYNELVGAIVQTGPNHTANNYNADLEVKASHPITDFLGPVGSIWNKNEEYYYWEQNGGQLSADNTVLLEVEETEDSGGNVNSYDAQRPITWYKESITYDDDNDANTADVTLSGIRSFYTALGHNGSDYNSNANFRTMLENATLWAMGNTLTIEEYQEAEKIKIAPNPVKNSTVIYLGNGSELTKIKLYDVLGKQIISKSVNPSTLNGNKYSLSMNDLNKGVYLLNISTKTKKQSFKVVKL